MGENRFAKSVQTAKQNTKNYEEKLALEQKANLQEETTATEKDTTQSVLNLNDIVSKKKKTTSSSHTIYLEDEVFKKITRAAKSREMTISAFINEVFKQMQM